MSFSAFLLVLGKLDFYMRTGRMHLGACTLVKVRQLDGCIASPSGRDVFRWATWQEDCRQAVQSSLESPSFPTRRPEHRAETWLWLSASDDTPVRKLSIGRDMFAASRHEKKRAPEYGALEVLLRQECWMGGGAPLAPGQGAAAHELSFGDYG
jgi:hypothetical protein